jgi:dTDP-4-amino-4,6-dideoxygalactose transaminase
MMINIPFNVPYVTENETKTIEDAIKRGRLSGDGYYTNISHDWLREKTLATSALLTHSCTAALEMAAILLDLKEGDEVIMPSYTFVSTANAFVLRGAVPVFVDIRRDTLNIDERLIEEAITDRTVAIVVVHYAGVACEMDEIMHLSNKYHLRVVEDAAQGIMATYKGRPLGTIGDFGTLSFHETKNVVSGEGGALLMRDGEFVDRAEIVREKGTDRSQFLRGEVDKYTWKRVGSSYLPSELNAAFLWSQLQKAQFITDQRKIVWNRYHNYVEDLENRGLLSRPRVPEYCSHNGHMYHVVLSPESNRANVLEELRNRGVGAISHYVPLHSSPAGAKFGRTSGNMKNTDFVASNLIRLPLWVGLTEESQKQVVNSLDKILS